MIYKYELLPAESYDDCNNAESHDDRMRAICKVYSENSEFRVTDQNEEQDEANEGAHKKQESKEEAFACPNTVNSALLRSGNGNSSLREHCFQALLKILLSHISGIINTSVKINIYIIT